ncbi:Serine/threonine protein kinase [Chondrus crispus]|uniref:Serine/threonine protein kinase n=1 Tax=Chondrus crispus TaxID=2769 RepID=R7QVJ4_CHOCR|nr:Serine/threonine protein kinase [Chondrus crispus]CDF41350.1 Serine/threonine protein kinase [Chondrus crispus]|eukprot:XP_005711644.1 Serine/threonine protein kinase [Chondrus crispus]
MVAQTITSTADYQVIKTLGAGSTGKVKLARHPRTNQLVALKIIRKDLLTTRRNLFTKVRREIAVMKLITGSCRAVDRQQSAFRTRKEMGVLQLVDVFDTDTSFVLVLEYCDGGELFDLLAENGYLPQPQVLDLFQQLVYALEFCHNRGICHRDLKPENVLLTSSGHVKLGDFGLASLLKPDSFLETACGSPQYCAPEVLLGDSYSGVKADIWSLGVVLYAMTTGGLPFDDDNLQRLATKISSGAFYMPAEVPAGLAQLLTAMLTVDPAQRATLDDVKASNWFNSSAPRKNIYKEEEGETMPLSRHDDPVDEPDRGVMEYLRDLGLGDDPTIRRRLRCKPRCLERDFYYELLDMCSDSPALWHGEPVAPRLKTQAAKSPRQIICVADVDVYVDAVKRPLLAPTLPTAWLWSLVDGTEGKAGKGVRRSVSTA